MHLIQNSFLAKTSQAKCHNKRNSDNAKAGANQEQIITVM